MHRNVTRKVKIGKGNLQTSDNYSPSRVAAGGRGYDLAAVGSPRRRHAMLPSLLLLPSSSSSLLSTLASSLPSLLLAAVEDDDRRGNRGSMVRSVRIVPPTRPISPLAIPLVDNNCRH